MTEQKSTQLSPEEWKQLCLLNVDQLLNFLRAIPAQGQVSETDTTIIAGLVPERINQIEEHLGRLGQFLRAWSRSRPVGFVPQPEAKPEPVADVVPKRRGRPPKAKAEAQASQH